MAAKYLIFSFVAVLSVQAESGGLPTVLSNLLADDLKGNVVECILAEKENIQAVCQETRAALVACAKNVEGLDDLVAQIKELEDKVLETAEQLVTDLKNCDDNDCRLEVLKEAHAKLQDLAVAIHKLAQQAIEIIESEGAEAKKCAKAALAEAHAAAKVIVQDVKKCISG